RRDNSESDTWQAALSVSRGRREILKSPRHLPRVTPPCPNAFERQQPDRLVLEERRTTLVSRPVVPRLRTWRDPLQLRGYRFCRRVRVSHQHSWVSVTADGRDFGHV